MQAQEWIIVLALASLSIVTTVGGVLLAVGIGDRPRPVATGIGFPAGTMVAVSIAELLPEAYRDGSANSVTVAVLAGAALLAALNMIVPHTHLVAGHPGIAPEQPRTAYLVIFGLVLHDFDDRKPNVVARIVDSPRRRRSQRGLIAAPSVSQVHGFGPVP